MKKLLLSCLAGCAALCASAASTDLTPVWNGSVKNAFGSDKVWSASVSVDKDGQLVASGAFSSDITIGSVSLSPVGTSAYVAKYDVTGNPLWAVGIIGAANVVDIDVDESGDIFVAGTYADEVIFGTTSGDEIIKEGQMVDGAPTSKLNSSFIAKYDADGKLCNVQTFIAQIAPEVVETGMYLGDDGDCYFRINHIEAKGGNVYASAVYTGITNVLGNEFHAYYNYAFGFMPLDLKSTAVFQLDGALDSVKKLVTCDAGENEATDDAQYDASAVAFTVANGSVYAVFAGNGPLKVTGDNVLNVDAQPSDYNYIFADVDVTSGHLCLEATQKCPDAGMETLNVPSAVYVKDHIMVVVGYEAFADNYGTADERIGHDVFTFWVKDIRDTNSWELVKETAEIVEGNVAYYGITDATRIESDETVLVSLLGYYTDKTEGENAHNKGDFAETSKVFMVSGKNSLAVPGTEDSYALASNGAYVALAQISADGQAFTLFNDPAGVGDVVVDNANAPVEYFNLQGVRVDNPANGLFIRRQAGKAAKVLVK